MTTSSRKLVNVNPIESVIKKPNINSLEKLKMIQKILNTPLKRKPKANPPPKGFISVNAAADKYHVSNATISKWITKDVVKPIIKTDFWTYIDENSLVSAINNSKRLKHIS